MKITTVKKYVVAPTTMINFPIGSKPVGIETDSEGRVTMSVKVPTKQAKEELREFRRLPKNTKSYNGIPVVYLGTALIHDGTVEQHVYEVLRTNQPYTNSSDYHLSLLA